MMQNLVPEITNLYSLLVLIIYVSFFFFLNLFFNFYFTTDHSSHRTGHMALLKKSKRD